MTAKFVLKRANNGKFHFNLQAANGEIIATSELYETKASAQKGIESVRMSAQRAEIDDRSEQAAPKSQQARQHSSMPKPQPPRQPSDMKQSAHAKA